ncbi:hypothetical protein PsYK624_042410 [Phanerochaete sordida]|uniref:Uncharacterized protein n=1 Tax=Phanerochaete sordida TaxID=48140 RepID=A0A9P3G321_9APHY|nr:hypothetical protein PsYK624_042410 [Phanerochaete sordida]
MSPAHDPELELLGQQLADDDSTGSLHAFKTAPIFTGAVFDELGPAILPQRALYGRVITQHAMNFPLHPMASKLYINTNAPFSALICGVQGSGKSHSTSVLLESCLMTDERLGTLPAPLSAIVFHFDTAAGGGAVQPCEAAYLAALDGVRAGSATAPTVTVLVLPTNVQAMRRVYGGLPSVRVEPLHFSAEDISGERLLAMMKVDGDTQMPLYMEAIMAILRNMESNFSYEAFREELKNQQFNPGQKAMLNLRLSLLDSCLKGGNSTNRVSTHFRQGQLTIIDLSSPFMDGSSACGFFDLILGLFIEADVKAAGKLVVLDEAHKYLSESQTGTSARLTESLLSPTVVPTKFLDLCSFILAHRFSSPSWLRLLAHHVSAADASFDALFAKIVALRTGQAVLFAPNALGVRGGLGARASDAGSSDSGVGLDDAGAVAPLAQGYLVVQSRLRVTRDGGHSILAVCDPEGTTRLGRVPGAARSEVPAGPGAGWGEASGWSAGPGAGWGYASTGWGAHSGGASASAGDPADASVPSEVHSSDTGTVYEDQPFDTLDTAVPAAVEHPGAGPVFDLTGDLARFRPLMEYVLALFTTPCNMRSINNICNGLTKKQPHVYGAEVRKIVEEAVQLGLLHQPPCAKGKPTVMLVQGATYKLTSKTTVTAPSTSPVDAGTSSFVLQGKDARYAPLVQYLVKHRDCGVTRITEAAIRRKFDTSVDSILSSAKERGMIRAVAKSSKPKVMLVPGATFEI